MTKLAISFTGGKDSTVVTVAYQLSALGQIVPDLLKQRCAQGVDMRDAEVALLVTFVPAGGGAFKAHPLQVIQQQAAALGVPHVVKEIAGPDYQASYQAAIKSLATDHGIQALVTGDILDVCSNFMGRACHGANMPLIRPLWHIPRQELLSHMWEMGITAVISCVNVRRFEITDKGADTAATAPTSNGNQTSHGSQHYEMLNVSARAVETHKTAVGEDQANLGESKVSNGCHGSAADPDGHYSCFVKPTSQKAQADDLISIDPVRDLLGATLSRDLHSSVILPATRLYGIDECGEMGEFHTMVVDAPTYKSKLEIDMKKCHEPGSDFAYLVPVLPV